MAKKKPSISRASIITFAIIISIMLYGAGVLSGLYANKIVKEETRETVESLEEYVDILDQNIKSAQLEQIFIETLDHEDMCKYSSISMNRLVGQLREYWARLPFRIEAYEQNAELSENYLSIKKDYTQLSIRTWIIANSIYEKCNTDLIPVLYLYDINCSSCVEQGQELDRLQQFIFKKSGEILIFTVDIDSDELLLNNMATYYNITSTPAIIVNDQILPGRVYSAEEILGLK